MQFMVNCRRCAGQGYYGFSPNETCATCQGHGQFYLEGFKSWYFECVTCKANGYIGLDPRDTCPVCGGYQYVHHTKRPLYRVINDEEADADYVDNDRLDELRNIRRSNFDLRRLIRVLEELNSNSSKNNYYSVAMLVRAVLDHVPPIFGKTSFIEVANNHGSKSFKEHMRHLEKSSRKVADAVLHSQIRAKEVLVNEVQVDSRKDLDVLLAEIVRILK